MTFRVSFSAESEPKNYPNGVHFKIEANGVLVISDGDDVIHYAPHAWTSVHSSQVPPAVF
jgi:hypothetical protein